MLWLLYLGLLNVQCGLGKPSNGLIPQLIAAGQLYRAGEPKTKLAQSRLVRAIVPSWLLDKYQSENS
jgi:hypothetical protein